MPDCAQGTFGVPSAAQAGSHALLLAAERLCHCGEEATCSAYLPSAWRITEELPPRPPALGPKLYGALPSVGVPSE